jgi:hypothetical protein
MARLMMSPLIGDLHLTGDFDPGRADGASRGLCRPAEALGG